MAAEVPSSSSASPAKIKVGGTWSGVLTVDLDTWTLAMLREEILRRSGAGPDRTMKLICGGEVLNESDGAHTLSSLGLKNNSKILSTAVSADLCEALDREAMAAAAEDDRAKKLARIWAAAIALAERHADGSLPVDDFNLELEDQSGQRVNLGSESDQKGVMMGLMLHSNGKRLIQREKYKDALDVLTMGEEAFALCDPKFIEMIDNVPMLQLDIVWCYFMLRDVSCLSVAGMRLAKARKGFDRAHGKDSTRLRLLQAGRHAELATYLRLELLEGVVAYHSGNFEESRKVLKSAESKYAQLQVPDEALSLLMNMGYKEKAAKRALRMTAQYIQSAVDFLVEERAKKMCRYQENIQRQKEIMEQKSYGTTPQKKAVDIQRLNELISVGFERRLAAEALRLNENDTQQALDLLTDPDKNCDLQRKIEARKGRASRITTANVEGLGHNWTADTSSTEASPTRADALGLPRDAGASASAPPASDDAEILQEEDRDEEMESEIAKELTQDAIQDYDMEVSKEGEAIAEYLSLLESTGTGTGTGTAKVSSGPS